MAATAEGLNPFRPRVLYTAYHVQDLDRSLAFYVGLLGLREVTRFQLPSGEWECVLSFVGEDGKPTGAGLILMWQAEREGGYALGDGYSRVVFKVSDLEAAAAHLTANDVKFSVPPTQAGNMRFALFRDPDGYTLELLQLG